MFAPCLFWGGCAHARVTEDTYTHTHTQCYTRTALPPPCHLLALPPCLFLFISLSLSFLLFPQCAVQSSVVEDVWPLTIHCGQGDTVHWIFFYFFFAQHNATCVALQWHTVVSSAATSKKKNIYTNPLGLTRLLHKWVTTLNLSFPCMCACR